MFRRWEEEEVSRVLLRRFKKSWTVALKPNFVIVNAVELILTLSDRSFKDLTGTMESSSSL